MVPRRRLVLQLLVMVLRRTKPSGFPGSSSSFLVVQAWMPPPTLHAVRKVPSVKTIVRLASAVPAVIRPGVLTRRASHLPPNHNNHNDMMPSQRAGGGKKLTKFVDKIFHDADTNGDGSISVAETYELVLRLYVQLNRQAPINPPTKESILQIFAQADANGDNTISRPEFTTLLSVLMRRAGLRLLAHKVVTVVGAPILEEVVVRTFLKTRWGFLTAQRILPRPLFHIVSNVSVWRTALLIFFVVTLGNAVLGLVNWCLDVAGSASSGIGGNVDEASLAAMQELREQVDKDTTNDNENDNGDTISSRTPVVE